MAWWMDIRLVMHYRNQSPLPLKLDIQLCTNGKALWSFLFGILYIDLRTMCISYHSQLEYGLLANLSWLKHTNHDRSIHPFPKCHLSKKMIKMSIECIDCQILDATHMIQHPYWDSFGIPF